MSFDDEQEEDDPEPMPAPPINPWLPEPEVCP